MSTHKNGIIPTEKMVNYNKGFTLVELIIVVAIVGILAAIAIPAYKGYIAVSKQKAAESVLEQFPVLIESYRAENGKMCPACDGNSPSAGHIYKYEEDGNGNEDTVGNKITNPTFLPDFRAKGLTADVSLYDYHLVFTVTGCPACNESVVATATPVDGRGAPSGDIVGDTYQ